MTTLMKLEINCETGEEILTPLTAKEIAELEQLQAANAERQKAEVAEATAKAEAKASALAKLEALGLTEQEIAAL